ncbi:hypothetical protein [Paraurantiacibacter namhicola]|uniref:VanZ like family protein n=1 Tax=Paraurantiacibacter namhicola TaxID=645517 RepID=A0A1C7D8I6_9SPHN|nr:hypothetical protein [Paraurantiacibacter namhicola]ANU07806.1 hypothetical protein A6F65_01503 [Paraurantiacibacter namhicola]
MNFSRLCRLAFWGALLFSFVMAVLPQPPSVPGDPTDKTLHLLAFATLGVLGSLGWPAMRWWALFGLLCAFGGLIEIVQMIPSLGRDAQWSDLAADCIAALLSTGGMAAIRHLRIARRGGAGASDA